ncbi:MAG: 30S ribosomal protein S6 [Armatimonadota bacterium]
MSEPTLYEAIYILDPSLMDEEVEHICDHFEGVVEEAGGEVLGTRDFRTRRLAYQIDGYTHGTYKLLYFFGTGATVEEVRQEMSIRQPIIRSRVFVANPQAIVGGMRTDEEIAAAEAAEAAAAAEAEAAKAAEAEAEKEAAEAAEAEEPEEPAEAAEAAEEAAEEAAPEAEEEVAEEAAPEAEEEVAEKAAPEAEEDVAEEAAPEAEEESADEADAEEAEETEE